MGILSTNHCWLSKWLPTILREEQSVPKHPIRAASALSLLKLHLSGSEISGVKCDEGGKVIHHLQSKFKGNSVILNPSIHFPPPLPPPLCGGCILHFFSLHFFPTHGDWPLGLEFVIWSWKPFERFGVLLQRSAINMRPNYLLTQQSLIHSETGSRSRAFEW